MPRIRNHALHAEWDKLSEPDVNSVIGFVEQFLLTNFNQPRPIANQRMAPPFK